MLELVHVGRRLAAEDLDRVLVSEVVRPLHRVERVLLGIVLGGVAERRVDAALGRAGMAANRVDLGEHRDVRAGVESLDRRAHARAAGPDDDDVVNRVHCEGRYLIVLVPETLAVERTSRVRSWRRSSAPCRCFLAPRQAPLHERSFQPFAGVAVRRTGLNDGKRRGAARAARDARLRAPNDSPSADRDVQPERRGREQRQSTDAPGRDA